MIYDFFDPADVSPGQPDFRGDVAANNPGYRVQDYDSPDMSAVKAQAEQVILASGADIIIYARTNNNDIDDVWDEDANPTYENPVPMRGFFVPQPMEQELTKWGVDQPNLIQIVFFRDHLYEQWKDRLLRSGDIFHVPYNSITKTAPRYYRVDTVKETGNYRYIWLYFQCDCTLITGDPNIRPHTDNDEELID